jgi:hypothetical protein
MRSKKLVQEYRTALDESDSSGVRFIEELHRRGGKVEFNLAQELIASNQAQDRIIGADLLGGLGLDTPTYVTESFETLKELLGDENPQVRGHALCSICWRCVSTEIPHSVWFTPHNDEITSDLQLLLAFITIAKYGAVDVLLTLASNKDVSLRKEATYYLSSYTQFNSKEVLDILVVNSRDESDEVKALAIHGLALREDVRGRDALLELDFADWTDDSHEYNLSHPLRTAIKYADIALYPKLQELEKNSDWYPSWFCYRLSAALEACAPPSTLTSVEEKVEGTSVEEEIRGTSVEEEIEEASVEEMVEEASDTKPEDQKSCRMSNNPAHHRWNESYPHVVCGTCGAHRDRMINDWCEKAGAPHELGSPKGCTCLICGEDVHDWNYELADSNILGEPATLFTTCRRCGFQNTELEQQRAYWAEMKELGADRRRMTGASR